MLVLGLGLGAADESVAAAAQRMAEKGVGTLVILNQAQRPVGLVTDRDLVVRVLAAGKDPQTTPLGDVMTRDPKVISEEGPIESALGLMRAGGFRRLPVVNRDGVLVGVLSLDDVLALFAEEFVQIGGLLQQPKPPPIPSAAAR